MLCSIRVKTAARAAKALCLLPTTVVPPETERRRLRYFLTYDIYDGISAGFAYSNSKRLGDQNSKLALGRGDNAETYTGGLKYDANNIYLATQYTQTYNATRAGSLGFADKAQNFEVVAQYQFDFGLRPSVAYLQSKGKTCRITSQV